MIHQILPTELMWQIFDHLSQPQQRLCYLICKPWLLLQQQKESWQNYHDLKKIEWVSPDPLEQQIAHSHAIQPNGFAEQCFRRMQKEIERTKERPLCTGMLQNHHLLTFYCLTDLSLFINQVRGTTSNLSQNHHRNWMMSKKIELTFAQNNQEALVYHVRSKRFFYAFESEQQNTFTMPNVHMIWDYFLLHHPRAHCKKVALCQKKIVALYQLQSLYQPKWRVVFQPRIEVGYCTPPKKLAQFFLAKKPLLWRSQDNNVVLATKGKNIYLFNAQDEAVPLQPLHLELQNFCWAKKRRLTGLQVHRLFFAIELQGETNQNRCLAIFSFEGRLLTQWDGRWDAFALNGNLLALVDQHVARIGLWRIFTHTLLKEIPMTATEEHKNDGGQALLTFDSQANLLIALPRHGWLWRRCYEKKWPNVPTTQPETP